MKMVVAWKQYETKKEKSELITFFMEAFSTSFFTNISSFRGSETQNQRFK